MCSLSAQNRTEWTSSCCSTETVGPISGQRGQDVFQMFDGITRLVSAVILQYINVHRRVYNQTAIKTYYTHTKIGNSLFLFYEVIVVFMHRLVKYY